MKKEEKMKCPVCGRKYTEKPALSRKDGKTLICPDCGIKEAFEAMGATEEEQNELLKRVHALSKLK